MLFSSSSTARTGGSRSSASLVTILAIVAGIVSAQDRTTEQGEAQIKDPAAECVPYTYGPVQQALSSFPRVWDMASLLQSDSAAQAEWNSIKGKIPTNISTKGTPTGDFSSFTPTYPATDPDCWWSYHQCTTAKLAGLQPDTIDLPEPKSFGIGFDDGPNCSHNAFYDYLSTQNQKATMFYIGSNVMNHPLEAQRAIADGHEVCVHTWSHKYMTALSSDVAFAELYYTRQAIKLVTGVTPTCWRPPYGDIDDRIRSIASAMGLRSILWTYDSNDWKNGIGNVTSATVDANYDIVVNGANNGTFDRKGTIMLTHELNNYTMSEMIKWYPKLKAAFASIVPVGVGLNITQPYMEANYSLPTFAQYIAGTTITSGSAPGSNGNSTAGQSAGANGQLDPKQGTNGNGGSGSSNSNGSGGGNGSSGSSTGTSGASSLRMTSMDLSLSAGILGLVTAIASLL